MVIKLYISGISGNKEVKKKQQRVQMILDSKQINYEAIDITEPGKEKDKEFMQQNGKVRETLGKYPLPPQIFNENDFCGDYEDFDMANEIDELEKFLHIETSSKDNGSDAKVNGLKEPVISIDDLTGESEQNEVKKSEVNGESETSPALEHPSENIIENFEISSEEVDPEKEESSAQEIKTNDYEIKTRSEKEGEENAEDKQEHEEKEEEEEKEKEDVENPKEETLENPNRENSPPLEEKDDDDDDEENSESQKESGSDDGLPQSEKSQE